MTQPNASDSQGAPATVEESTPSRVEDVPPTSEQIAYERGTQDHQVNTVLRTIPNKILHLRRIMTHLEHREFEYNKALKALKKYESGAPDERAMREIARKVDNVYNMDGAFLKDLHKVFEDEMMAAGTETTNVLGLPKLPALPEFQQPRGNKTTLIGMTKAIIMHTPLTRMSTPITKPKAAAKKRKVMHDESDEDNGEED